MPVPSAILALVGGGLIMSAFVVVMFLAIVYGFYTYSGSMINAHPNDGLDGAPGSAGPSDAAGKGRSTGTTSPGHSTGDTFSPRGTG